MNKYVIELRPDCKVVQQICESDGQVSIGAKSIEYFEELNSDYINEHFGDLQDTAYQRGLEDAWEAARRVAFNPHIGGLSVEDLEKAFDCLVPQQVFKNYTAQQTIEKLKAYEEKQKADDKIEVGDEVADKDGDKTIVTNIHGDLFDGLCSDGSTMTDLFLDDNHKTGRHFDIAKILEEMRHD